MNTKSPTVIAAPEAKTRIRRYHKRKRSKVGRDIDLMMKDSERERAGM
jgi:hypothetical protein